MPLEETKTDDAKGTPEATPIVEDADRAGISSIPVSLMSGPDLSAANISTVEPPQPKAEAGEIKDGEKDPGKSGEDTRYDKIPRFKEILGERDTEKQARIAAEAKIAEYEKQLKADPATPAAPVPTGEVGTKPPAEELPYKDITLMSPEEIREWMEEDPIGYESNKFAQFHHESKKLLEQEAAEKQRTDALHKTFDDYAKENPDFKGKWDSGEIEKFMAANPGHNAISAHMMMTADARKAETDKAVKKAIKETEARVIRNFQAKRNATVLTDEPGVVPGSGPDPILNNTRQHGGFTRVMADKLTQMRQAPQ